MRMNKQTRVMIEKTDAPNVGASKMVSNIANLFPHELLKKRDSYYHPFSRITKLSRAVNSYVLTVGWLRCSRQIPGNPDALETERNKIV